MFHFERRPEVSSAENREHRKQVHNDCSFLDCFLDFKKILARNPSVLFSLFPGSSIFTDPNDDVQPVITSIQSLTMSTSKPHMVQCTLEIHNR